MSKLCLCLVCPPSIEERVLDELLEVLAESLFTSSAAYSHGHLPSRMAAQEQVLGRSASKLVQVIVDEAALRPLLEHLGAAFKGAGLRYWASAVVTEGEL